MVVKETRGCVLAVGGALGSGKAELARQLVKRRHAGASLCSFAEAVRQLTIVPEGGGDPGVAATQDISQHLVTHQCAQLVEQTLRQAHQSPSQDCVVHGLRHVEVLLELQRQVHPRSVIVVMIATSRERRLKQLASRLNKESEIVNSRQLAQWDAHVSEEQVPRILPQYAHCTVNGDLPVELQVGEVIRRTSGLTWKKAEDS